MADELVLLHQSDVARPDRALDARGGRRALPHRMLDYGTTMKAPDYLAINPMGKVPAIQHGGRWSPKGGDLRLSRRRLSRRRPRPAAGRPRGAYYRWLFFAAGPLEAAIDRQGAGRRHSSRAGADGRAMAA